MSGYSDAEEMGESFISIEDATRRVIATGEFDGCEVQYSNDGIIWAEVWVPTDEHAAPAFAKATVFRKGVRLPAVGVARWESFYPEEGSPARAWWDQLKEQMLSKVARMTAFRQQFGDVLGGVYDPAESHQRPDRVPGAPAHDWFADVTAATDRNAVIAIHAAARNAKSLTDELGESIADRLTELAAAAVETATAPAPKKPASPKPRVAGNAKGKSKPRSSRVPGPATATPKPGPGMRPTAA